MTAAVPTMYYMVAAYMGWSPGTVQAFLTMSVSSITMFNPLTTVFFMRCYRMVLLKPFLKKRPDIRSATRVTGLEVATNTWLSAPSTAVTVLSDQVVK